MSNLQAVQGALDTYHSTYRNPTLGKLRLSKPYALFPDTPKPADTELAGKWPDDVWPNVDRPGVYLFLDANLEILYIGKTSLRQTFGARFYDWFKYEKGTRRCEVVGEWSQRPAYVATVPVQAPFEAPSL